MAKMIKINGYDFEGHYPLVSTSFNDVAGVYFISDGKGSGLDVGETDALATRLSNHERKSCWERHKSGSINVWFHAEDDRNRRLAKEKTIRNLRNFSCGQI